MLDDFRRKLSARVFLAELVDATAAIDHLLLTGIERMAIRADFDLQVVAQRRTRWKRVAAAAGHGNVFVLRMNAGFHGVAGLEPGSEKGARSVAAPFRARKLTNRIGQDAFHRDPSESWRFGYPQNLWITLWMSAVFRIEKRAIARPLLS